ncbi:hypothetical protein UFOVP1193_23 [uncultured Caudovirales phage]|uniref:Uncharacterized protein n=1 Tax=uncultured Caudovirales phage TaxID=2100421 RepID=A0A6J5RE98_9CAUD|nr:hypothetical protein UFOVP1193_23 [uncultured Caudovirales phage]
MTKVFDHTHYKYTPDPENPRLISENYLKEENAHYWKLNGLQRSFAERLLSKFPKWQCVHPCNGRGFKVLNGTEYLGAVRCYDGKLEISNHRIDKARTRKGGMVTKDPDKAFKLVCKYFSTKTNKELCASVLLDTGVWIKGEQYNSSTNFRMQLTNLAYAARDYIMQDLEPYRAAAKAGGYDMTKCSQVENLYARSSVSTVMQAMFEKNLGSVIRRGGDGYLLSNPNGTEVTSVHDMQLSGPVREALGKLKLLDNRTMLEGVGARIDTDIFFVVVK